MKKDLPNYFMEEMKKYKHSHYCDGVRFEIGPLLGLTSGLRKAKEIGLDYVVYRNGDDWLFNHDFVLRTLMKVYENKDIAAYNWLSKDSMLEFALNEMYLRVNVFAPTVDDAENYFRLSKSTALCELKVSKWIKKVIGKNNDRFYRLPGRELDPGVGYEVETLPEVFRQYGMPMPDDLPKILESNQRFFNKEWQLIGSHDNYKRYRYYSKIRQDIGYHQELERQKHFSRWLESIGTAKKWNLTPEKRKISSKIPLVFDKRPRIMTPKMLIPVRKEKYGKN